MSAPDTVLIVDDEPIIRRMLATFLSRAGWNCLEASSSGEALEVLKQGCVTHAIVDIHLGAEFGYDLIRAARRGWPDVRIVALTGSAISGPAAARAAGAAEVLTKPLVALGTIVSALKGTRP